MVQQPVKKEDAKKKSGRVTTTEIIEKSTKLSGDWLTSGTDPAPKEIKKEKRDEEKI